jgi:HAD superfamily hydrolase (TIGR01490 family)
MKSLALFDLDHTLIPIDSDHAWGEFMLRQGWADPVEFGRSNDVFFAQYQAGTLDIHEYIEFATRPWRDRPAAEQAAAQAVFLREVVGPVLTPAAHALVKEHQDCGDLVAIVTATNEFVTAPIAAAFGVDHLLAVRLERGPAGNITGRIDGVPSFREGKTRRTEQWLAGLGHKLQDFGRVSVYSDSTNDLPLLELATDAVATNPSPSLETIARARGWRILRLFP